MWPHTGPFVSRGSDIQFEIDLLSAIERGEIEIVFQPQYALEDDRLIGAEALARWYHPIAGMLDAESLFQIATRADYVAQLSRHIAERALGHAITWPAHLTLSINMTSVDLASSSFVDDFSALVGQVGFAAERITLEIIEKTPLDDLDQACIALSRLRQLGYNIALDDFGAGFCNFTYLKALPLDYIKLDRSMAEGVPDDARDIAIFRAIMAMARALDLDVIAEGIETQAQRDFCAAQGCKYYQGFLRSEPIAAAKFLILSEM